MRSRESEISHDLAPLTSGDSMHFVERTDVPSAGPEANSSSTRARLRDAEAPRGSRRAANGDQPRRRLGAILAIGIPLLATLLVLIGSQAWIMGLPNEYTAKTAIAFSPRVTASGVIPGSESLNLQAAKYVVLLEADPTTQTAAKASGISATDLSSGATTSVIVPGTATLSISVTAGDPKKAAAAANSFANQIMARAKTDPVLTAEQIVVAVPPPNPSGPATTILSIVAAVASLLLGLAMLMASLATLRFLRTHPKGQRLPGWLSANPADTAGSTDSGSAVDPSGVTEGDRSR